MSEVPPRSWLPAGLIALRERNFVLYVIGQFTSQFGNWIETTAVSWIIYDMTHSPFLLGLNGLFRAIPTISLALFGGAIADRVPRRLLLMCTESTMLIGSFTMGTLAATGNLQYWHLYVLNAVSGTIQAFSVPARHALFAGLVPRSSMQSAVTLNSVAVRGGAFLGPTISGLALGFGSYALPFYMNAVTFLAMLAALIMMRLPRIDGETKPRRESLRHGMMEGVAFVWNTPLLKVVLALELATGLFGYNTALLTIIVRDILHAGPEGLGLVLSANGAGAMLGMTLLVTFRIQRHAQLILTLGCIYTCLWAGFAFSQLLWLSIILNFMLGTVDSMWGVTRNTVAQLLATDALRGRVMSVVMLVTRGSSQFGRVQSGFLVSLVGAPAAVLVGVGIIGAAVLSSFRVPLPKRLVRTIPSGPDEEKS